MSAPTSRTASLPLTQDGARQAALIDEQMLHRSVALVIQQSRIGMVTALVICFALGGLFVPAAGWGLYLAWLIPVVAGFVLRQFWFERLKRRTSSRVDGSQLTKITAVSALTGWFAILCLPLLAPRLPLADTLFVSVLLLAWVVGAVSVLGVQPRVYALYMLACLATIYSTLWQLLPALELWIMALAITMGAVMMYRLAHGMRSLLRDTVVESARNLQLAMQLDTALQSQKSAFETRSRFLASASHDMKQPVQALTLLVNVLRRTNNEQRRSQVTEEIEQAAQAIDSMFTSLLDIARIDAGSMQAQNCPIELRPLLRTVLAGYQGQCEDKALRFIQRLDAAPVVSADPLLLQRVMRNLLENALKYTPRGSITLSVTERADGALVTIEDSGIGMTPEEQRGLFQAFTRGISAQEIGVPGLGLGLAIARHMAGLMGADLSIQSEKDKGTTACLLLRYAQVAPPRPADGDTPSLLTGEHAVVLEDDALARAALTHWLQEAGATVTSAASAAELWPLLENTPAPTLVLADMHLGPHRENGIQVVQQLHRLHPGAQAVLVTGESSHLAVPPGIEVLHKPVDIQTLVKVLKRPRMP